LALNALQTWVLILTMNSSNAKFVDHIEGFDRGACVAAASLWLDRHPSNGFHQYDAICVSKTGLEVKR
jgi:hypothetical protein